MVLGEDQETFSAGITGSADIPVVQVVKSASDAIEAALDASQPVSVSGTDPNSFEQNVPGDDDKLASFSSRGIRNAGDVKPDVSAVGQSVFSAGMGTGDDGLSDSGTSMATPMVAGLSALVRSENSSWNPEQVKADIMNTADQDLFTGSNHSGDTYAPEPRRSRAHRREGGTRQQGARLRHGRSGRRQRVVRNDRGDWPDDAAQDDQARQPGRIGRDVRHLVRRLDLCARAPTTPSRRRR